MSQKAVIISLIAGLAVVGLALLLFGNQEHTFNGVLYQNPEPAPEFVLNSEKGEFALADQKGKLVLVFFGYTFCPDVCPSTLSDMKKVIAGLDGDPDSVEVVFITVDPDRDTVEKLSSYVALFNSDFVGLTGRIEDLEAVWKSYGVVREVDNETESVAGYLINHTARIYLIDKQGNLLMTYGFGTPPEEILEDVEYLIGEE